MAAKKSAKYPHRWSNGTYHSRPEQESDLPGIQFPTAPGRVTITTRTPVGDPSVAAAVRPYLPAAQAPSQIPLDPAQEATNVYNQRNLGISEATAAYDQGRIENEYGLGLDKSNPYSRARLLEETYKRSQRGTTNNYAAQGQLYSGAYGRMQGENTRNYSMNYDQLSRDYTDQLRNVQLGRLQSYGQYGTTGDEAAFQALLKAYRGG